MLSIEKLDQMSKVEIKNIDKKELIDIQTINVDTQLPIRERLEKYIDEIKNPYCFLCGDTVVKIIFDEDGCELTEKLKNYFIRKNEGCS